MTKKLCILTARGVVHNINEHKCNLTDVFFKCTANPVQPFKCKLCSFETKLKVILKKHVVCFHNKGSFLYDSVKYKKCRACDFQTYSVLVLLKHELKHERKQRYRTPTVYKEYNKDETEEFVKHHMIEKPLRCSFCSYVNSNVLILKEHMQRIHNNPSLNKPNVLSKDKGQWYKCEQCSFKCRRVGQFKDHVYNCHTDDKDKVWFKCKQCPFNCTRKHQLDRHVTNCRTFKNEQLKCMMKCRLNDIFKRRCKSESCSR